MGFVYLFNRIWFLNLFILAPNFFWDKRGGGSRALIEPISLLDDGSWVRFAPPFYSICLWQNVPAFTSVQLPCPFPE